jgi:uncharacterized membrane protein
MSAAPEDYVQDRRIVWPIPPDWTSDQVENAREVFTLAMAMIDRGHQVFTVEIPDGTSAQRHQFAQALDRLRQAVYPTRIFDPLPRRNGSGRR